MLAKVLVSAVLCGVAFTPSAGAAPPLCRHAKAGAVRYATHFADGFATHVRYHDCGRWHGDREQLWFRFTAEDVLFGRISYWVRATWHGGTGFLTAADVNGWHYYARYVKFTATLED